MKAFAAGLEREKIAERTMRGKAERARSGRLPQGAGRGLYGYQYDAATGHREVVEDLAVIVCRLFTEFAEGASIVSLANALNDEGVLTMTGKRWSPATVFHLLQQEAYSDAPSTDGRRRPLCPIPAVGADAASSSVLRTNGSRS